MFIPSFIERKQDNISKSIIPKNIIQTFRTNDVHPYIYDNIQKMITINTDFNYFLITDEEGEEMIRNNCNASILNAYLKLNLGSAKADFIRYVALYLYGGVYLDMDAGIQIELSTFIPNDKDFIFFLDQNINLLQWCIISAPGNSILKHIISEMVNRINNGEKNIFLATGPTLFNDAFINYINGSNVYNSLFNINVETRTLFFTQMQDVLNGVITYHPNHKTHFLERIDNFENNMLYDETHQKYELSFMHKTPFLYKNDKNEENI